MAYYYPNPPPFGEIPIFRKQDPAESLAHAANIAWSTATASPDSSQFSEPPKLRVNTALEIKPEGAALAMIAEAEKEQMSLDSPTAYHAAEYARLQPKIGSRSVTGRSTSPTADNIYDPSVSAPYVFRLGPSSFPTPTDPTHNTPTLIPAPSAYSHFDTLTAWLAANEAGEMPPKHKRRKSSLNPKAAVFIPGQPATHTTPSPLSTSNVPNEDSCVSGGPFPTQLDFQPRVVHQKSRDNNLIPLYGSLHGMSYDPNTRHYVGDGPPRLTPERPDGSTPCQINHDLRRLELAAKEPKGPMSDLLHVQTEAFVQDNLAEFGVGEGIYGVQEYRFCRCANRWFTRLSLTGHVCEGQKAEVHVQGGRLTLEDVSRSDWAQKAIKARGHQICKKARREVKDNGNGDMEGVAIRDIAEFFVDCEGQKVWTGMIVRDFAYPEGKGSWTIKLD